MVDVVSGVDVVDAVVVVPSVDVCDGEVEDVEVEKAEAVLELVVVVMDV